MPRNHDDLSDFGGRQPMRRCVKRQRVKTALRLAVPVLLLPMAACSSDAYSAAHSGTSLIDSILIWDRSPNLNRDFTVNPYGLLNDAFDPTVWGNRPLGDGWARARGEPWER